MTTPRPVLAYLLYGGSDVHWRETEVSIHSALSFLGVRGPWPLRLVVATDQPERAGRWPVEPFPITTDQLADWMGPDRYNHRVKNRVVAALLDASEGAPVCLVDGDTTFRASPTALFERVGPGRSLMHADEGLLEQDHPDVYAAVKDVERDGEAFLRPGARMMNSGVIGLHPTDRACLDESLAWMDVLFAASGNFTIEQVTDGEALRWRTRVGYADDLVFHYWGFPRSFLRHRVEEHLRRTARLDLEGKVAAVRRLDTSLPRPPRWAQALVAGYGRIRGWSDGFRFLLVSALAARGAVRERSAWRSWTEELTRVLSGQPDVRRWMDDPMARAVLRGVPIPPR